MRDCSNILWGFFQTLHLMILLKIPCISEDPECLLRKQTKVILSQLVFQSTNAAECLPFARKRKGISINKPSHWIKKFHDAKINKPPGNQAVLYKVYPVEKKKKEEKRRKNPGITNLKQGCLVTTRDTWFCSMLGGHCAGKECEFCIQFNLRLILTQWDLEQFTQPSRICLFMGEMRKNNNAYFTGKWWGPYLTRYSRNLVAAAWHVSFPSVCPAWEKVNRSDLKQGCKVFKVHFSPALLHFSFPSCWLPFQARNLSLTVVYWLNWNDSSQYVAWKQISNYFVSNCRMYVKEYLDLNRKMRGNRDGSREADSEVPWNEPGLLSRFRRGISLDIWEVRAKTERSGTQTCVSHQSPAES